MMKQQEQTVPGEIQRKPNRIVSFFLHFLLPLAALACGIAITIYLMKTSPEAKPRKRPPTATLVEVQKMTQGAQQTVITSMGEVVPAREIDLKPRVSGAVSDISGEFVPGGFFLRGETMLTIDPADYALVVRQLESDAARAESDLLLEMGNQRIAAKEFQILNESVSAEEQALILRKPQLAKLEATKAFAEAKLAQARLDLERTTITAPFNSVINSRNVDTGARINESTVLAHLVGTDVFWLKLSLPVEQLQWVKIPVKSGEVGSNVRVYPQGNQNEENYRSGRVIRLVASLEEQGRMAQILVQVDDPLSLKDENRNKPQLLLGSYVRAEIEGKTIPSGIGINRENLREGKYIWLMTDEGLLDIQEVSVIFRNRDQVIIQTSIKEGERIVTSSLSSPVAGIPLRLQGDDLQAGTKGGRKKVGQQEGKTNTENPQGRLNSAE